MNTHSDISPNPKQKDFHFLNKYQTPYIEQNISNLNLANGAVEIIKCLSDVTKLKIIILLSKTKNASVSDISKLLIIEASTVSHALKDLKQLGLVQCEKCGRIRCYQLSNEKIKPLITEIENLLT